jgi:predicted dehydrogenase
MDGKTYRGAVIGLGVMGQIADGLGGKHPIWYPPCCHADAYAMHPRTELVAGATRDEGRQKRFKTTRGQPVFGDYQEMLNEIQPDIVSVATPATAHAKIVIAAAESGVKAIWCEKARATSLAECDEMITACKTAGVALAINHNRRWDDRYTAYTQMVKTGVIGELQAVHSHFGGGRLCRGGSHAFDLARYFVGEDIVWGHGGLSNPDDPDPGGTGVFESQSGVRIFVDGAVGMKHILATELVGDQGVLNLVDDGFNVQLWTPDERVDTAGFGMLSRRQLPMNYAVRSPFLNVLDDLILSIETGRPNRSTGEEGRAAFEMITAIHLSHHSHKSEIKFPIEERGYHIPSN